jgi:hypothetical protein
MKEFVNLYRHILKLHRLLPSEMKTLGDNYVKTEFNLHKKIKDPKFLETFHFEWAQYAEKLLEQVSHDFKMNSVEKSLGAKIELKRLSEFNDDQLYNLMELRKFALNENEKKTSENSENEKKMSENCEIKK